MLCLSLESAPFISSSTSFWYQFIHFRLTYSFTHHFFLFWFITLLIHNSLSFTPGLKPTSFTNPTPVVYVLPPGLPSRTIAWTVSSELIGFLLFLLFPYFFVSGPCARLSWPSRQLLWASWAQVNLPPYRITLKLTPIISRLGNYRTDLPSNFVYSKTFLPVFNALTCQLAACRVTMLPCLESQKVSYREKSTTHSSHNLMSGHFSPGTNVNGLQTSRQGWRNHGTPALNNIRERYCITGCVEKAVYLWSAEQSVGTWRIDVISRRWLVTWYVAHITWLASDGLSRQCATPRQQWITV